VHIFLQLFFERFPELGKKPFHLAGESWGGHFVPHIASNIFHGNRDIDAGRASGNKINLASIMIGNGMTDALHQFPPLAEYMCEGPYALLQSGSKECAALYDKSMRCERMVKACYDYNNPLVCMPAERYCWGLMNPVFGTSHAYALLNSCTLADIEK
jgi:cathepsin A (carboxypeptidase C)